MKSLQFSKLRAFIFSERFTLHAASRFLVLVLAVVALGFSVQESSAQTPPARVDLRSWQSDIRNQGSRTTCTWFASVAALEAAYARAGRRNLDLSEEFGNFVGGKAFWLHTAPNPGPDGQETQAGWTSGGGAASWLRMLAEGGMRIPTEAIWPYRAIGYPTSQFPEIGNPPTYWSASQRNTNNFNLDNRNINKARVTAAQYYSGTTSNNILTVWGGGPRGQALVQRIESELAANREVVVDANLNWRLLQPGGPDTRIMDACTPPAAGCNAMGPHGMLIVGYDRQGNYFIVKNSWGRDGNGLNRSDGYLYVTYNFVRNNVYEASSLNGVRTPGPWPELAFVGRWDIVFDGHRAQLDIMRLPGMMQMFFDGPFRTTLGPDRRIGRVYMPDGSAHAINGTIRNNTIVFHLDGRNRIPSYAALSGRRFEYVLQPGPNADIMTGAHQDVSGGPSFGGYAVRRGYETAFPTPNPRTGFTKLGLGGAWTVHAPTRDVLQIRSAVRGPVSATTRDGRAITGRFVGSDEHGQTFILDDYPVRGQRLELRRMYFQGDVAAGYVKSAAGQTIGPALMRQDLRS